MRVVDLDRDMSDVIPTNLARDSEFLFARMTEVTLDSTGAGRGRRVLDVGSGVGQDSVALARRGARVVGAEPSARMAAMAQLFQSAPLPDGLTAPTWVRGWADALPFAAQSFDASFCKGALDHFDAPESAIAEMARVTRRDGVVVLAIANFDSLACRVTRAIDGLRQEWLGLPPLRTRRGYDTPSDHFTRYELDLMREQAERALEIDRVIGISLGWGMPGWTALLSRLPASIADLGLRAADWLARRSPSLADVVVLVGRPAVRGAEPIGR
ncbi:MAG: methyltransferase domain-containing protein [Deltaproteobacteria bacterium]|nr:methyltransferase domain-containing protein [Deltaproteobacteria bacterium]